MSIVAIQRRGVAMSPMKYTRQNSTFIPEPPMKMPRSAVATFVLAVSLAGQEKPGVDPALMTQINQLKAIDNHAHPPALVNPGEKDDDFDALPCDPLEPTTPGLLFRQDNRIYLEAWKSLFTYKYDDASPEHVRELLAAKQKT